MAKIEMPEPIAHPAQSGVFLKHVAVEQISLTNGSGIDHPPSLSMRLRPYIEAMTEDQTPVWLSAYGVSLVDISIPDLNKWIAERAAAGDMKPLQAITAIIEVVGEEYARRNPKPPPAE